MLCAAASEMWADTRRGENELKKKVDNIRRGHFRLHCCLQLVQVSYTERFQSAGKQRGSRPMGMSDCNQHCKMEGNTTLSTALSKFLPECLRFLLHILLSCSGAKMVMISIHSYCSAGTLRGFFIHTRSSQCKDNYKNCLFCYKSLQ